MQVKFLLFLSFWRTCLYWSINFGRCFFVSDVSEYLKLAKWCAIFSADAAIRAPSVAKSGSD